VSRVIFAIQFNMRNQRAALSRVPSAVQEEGLQIIFDLASFLRLVLMLDCVSDAKGESLKSHAVCILTYVTFLGWYSNAHTVFVQYW